MRRDQQIRVNELLLQREELFLRIHAVETEASRVLGEAFPFLRPPLPSDFRARRKPGGLVPSAVPATANKPRLSVASAALRRLETDEMAYRITYRQFNKVVVEIHYDHAALVTFFASPANHLHVLSLNTLDADGRVRAVLIKPAVSSEERL